MLFSQIIHWLICAIQLINIDTVSENKIDTSGVVFVLPAADHRSGMWQLQSVADVGTELM